MQNNDTITLVLVCDNHLVVMLGVLLKSIEQNHTGRESINIYIVNDGINKTNIDKINRCVTLSKIRLIWKTLKQAIPTGVSLPLDRTSFPVCAYARICAPYFLPQHITKAIYLDVDMLILKDINHLWNIDIGNYTIAAVLDRSEKVSSPWGGIKNYKELGMNADTKYFNSGLLIINLEKWRLENATEAVIEAVNANSEYVTFADQYGLNIVFINNWFELNAKWNSYSQNDNDDPYLIHFTGMKPIFKGYNYNKKYKDLFYNYIKLTPWFNFRAKNDYLRFGKKILNVFFKKMRSFYFVG